jgi:hypothetical protein
MPRKRKTGISQAVRQIAAHAHQLLTRLRDEIRAREAHLQSLKREEGKLTALAKGSAGGGTFRRSLSRRGSKRISWGAVLEQLPRQFKASDIRQVRGIKDKRSSELFAAITRWIEAGSVKKKARGAYVRVK